MNVTCCATNRLRQREIEGKGRRMREKGGRGRKKEMEEARRWKMEEG